MEILIFFIFIFIIIVLSGLISGSEAALLSISYTKVKEIASNAKSKSRKKRAESLLIIKEDIQKYISTIVVLNNIVNIIGSVYAGVLASKIFGEAYLAIISSILTFLIIMFSEIIPKIYGEKHSTSISLKIAKPLIFLTKVFSPIIFILNKISNFFIKKSNFNKISEGEIREMASLGCAEGSINSYENNVIRNVFRMNDIEVFEIMIPLNKVTTFDIDTSFNKIVQTVDKTGFTRFPVSKNGEIIGLINVKDLFKYHNKKGEFSISKILRPIIYAPEAMKIITLEEKLKKKRIHMAAIVNEHGDFTGIVTLEDIIEELLGEIEDEFDAEKEKLIKQVSKSKYHIKANFDIVTINETLGLDLPINDEFTTLNGYLVSKFDGIPRANDVIEIGDGSGYFRVLNSSKKKVLNVEYVRV